MTCRTTHPAASDVVVSIREVRAGKVAIRQGPLCVRAAALQDHAEYDDDADEFHDRPTDFHDQVESERCCKQFQGSDPHSRDRLWLDLDQETRVEVRILTLVV